MMEWEGPLMEQHAQVICVGGGHMLNVGFGLGLVDEAIQVCVCVCMCVRACVRDKVVFFTVTCVMSWCR